MTAPETHRVEKSAALPLGQRVIHGGFWIFGLQVSLRLVNFITLFVLARFLTAADFGVLGLGLLVISLLEVLSATGFEAALIQKQGEIRDYLNTAWTISVVRGIALGGIVYLSAPWVADFFKNPLTGSVLMLLAFSLVLTGFQNVSITLYRRELNFRKIFIWQISGALTNAAVSITLALLWKNVWALVLGTLAERVVTTVLTYTLHPYRPSWEWNKTRAKELFHYGKWLLGSGILIYCITQGDHAFLGKVLGVAAVGFYTLAYKISNLPATEITFVISEVMFPAYSRLQDDPKRLKEAYLKTLNVLAFLATPLAGMIFVLGHDFTLLFLGNKWLPMVPVLQILSVMGWLRALSASTGPLFQAIGKPDIQTKLSFLRLLIIAVLIYPLTMDRGIVGTAWTILISGVVIAFMALYIAAHVSGNSLRTVGAGMAVPLILTLVMGAVLYLSRDALTGFPPLATFLAQGVLGVVLYLGMSHLCARWFRDPPLPLLWRMFSHAV